MRSCTFLCVRALASINKIRLVVRRKRDEVEIREEEKDIYLFVIFKLNVTVVLCGWSVPPASCRWDGHVILSHCL